jgi:hypothetical protein
MTWHDRRRQLESTRSKRSAAWAARGLCCVGLCVATTAHAESATSDPEQAGAQDHQEATKAFLNGRDYFESGRFAEAQEQFQKAYVLTKDPALLYDLGQTYRKMGRCPEARQAYEQFLRAAPDSPLAGRAQKHLVALQSSCAAAAASANATDSPAIATGGFGEAEPSAASEPAVPSASGLPSVPPAARPTSPPRQGATAGHWVPPALESRAEAPWRWLPWATMVSGLVAAGTAIGLEIYNQPRDSRRDAEGRNLEEGPSAGETDEAWAKRQEDNDRLGRSIDAVDTAALTAGIAGAALIVTSGVLFHLIPAGSAAEDAARRARALDVRITSCDATPVGVTLSGAF